MKSHDIANLIEHNTAEFFVELGRLNKDEICDTSQIKYIFSKNWQSRIFMANFNELNSSDKVRNIISRIKELNIPVLWFVTPMSRPKSLKKILNDYGFNYQNSWRAMAIDLKTVPEKFELPDCMQIKRALNLDEIKNWTDVLVESFQFPFIVTSYKKYFINAGIDDLNFNYYSGYLNGKAVVSSIFFKGKFAAGIFYIGTIPEVRGKGIAQAMVNYILNKAKKEGYMFCVLQASEMGYPLYKKIGFKEYYTTDIYRYKKPI